MSLDTLYAMTPRLYSSCPCGSAPSGAASSLERGALDFYLEPDPIAANENCLRVMRTVKFGFGANGSEAPPSRSSSSFDANAASSSYLRYC